MDTMGDPDSRIEPYLRKVWLSSSKRVERELEMNVIYMIDLSCWVSLFIL